MFPFARSVAGQCLVLFVVSVSYAGAAATNSQPNSKSLTADSSQNSASDASTVNISVMVDALSNRHPITAYVYGGSYPRDSSMITDSGMSVVRWGGNAASRYNWQLFTYNAANDWYFEDFNYSEIGDGDSTKFITDVKNAGSNPLMTMVMLPWVAQTAENGSNGHWSFSVAKYGAQCSVDPYNTDAGDGLEADCSTTLAANPNDANVPLLDQPASNDPAGSVYRNQWAAALASAFGSAPHFYDMDNEVDIWGSTHRDVHPSPAAYNEMRDTFVTEARNLKGWDSKAIRLGPVSCCWWFYWNGADSNDKNAHAGVDLLPWWLNEVYWEDKVAGQRSVDVFDVHAYPDGPDTSTWTQAEKQALTARIYRDYWDPAYVSESGTINQNWATFIQPNKTIPFRIPRMRALANMIYPGTPVAFTEWSAAFAGESDFSTALGDADAYGILGRERMYLASRWTAPSPGNPNYLALKLFTNYDGQHHGFATTSVSDMNNGDPDLFSSYAAVNSTGTVMTLLVLNKDPSNSNQATFTLSGFTPQSVTSYTLSSTNPTQIVASQTTSWSPTVTVNPYTAELLVVTGTMKLPGAEWDLSPDTTMMASGKTVLLAPKVTSGKATVTLGTPSFDSGITVTVNQASLSKGQNGKITVTAGNTPGFYHYSVPSTDSNGITQTQGGYILVGNPPATFTKTGDHQRGAGGSQLTLTVTLNAEQSGGNASGGTVLFTATSGTLSSRVVDTDSNGNASVVLTLPSKSGTVHVTAEGQYALGHPQATFTETVH